jgi:hypothetical protein
MPPEIQILKTKQFGDVRVVRSFNEPPLHIALCDNGAYVHTSGLPVKDKSDLRKAIPLEFLPAALDWFDNRHKATENAPLRLMMEGDGSFVFEDGSPVESLSQLVTALKPGKVLDAAIDWFREKQKTQEAAANPVKPKAKAPKKKAAPRKAPPRPGSKEAAAEAPAATV